MNKYKWNWSIGLPVLSVSARSASIYLWRELCHVMISIHWTLVFVMLEILHSTKIIMCLKVCCNIIIVRLRQNYRSLLKNNNVDVLRWKIIIVIRRQSYGSCQKIIMLQLSQQGAIIIIVYRHKIIMLTFRRDGEIIIV